MGYSGCMAVFPPGPPPDLRGEYARARLRDAKRGQTRSAHGERTRAQLDEARAPNADSRPRAQKRPRFAPLRRIARAIRGGG